MPLNPGVVEKDNIKTIQQMSGIPVIAVINEFDFLKINKNLNDCMKNEIANFANQLVNEFSSFQIRD